MSGKRKFLLFLGTALFLAACQSTIDVNPKTNWRLAEASSGKNYYDMGKTYLESSDYGLAIDAFRQDLRLNGANVLALNGMGISFDMLGRYDISQKYYDRALSLDAQSPITFSNIAYSQYLQGEYKTAETLAGMAQDMLKAKKEKKLASFGKVIEGNKEIFEDRQAQENEQNQAEPPSEDYVIEKVDMRSWKTVLNKQKAAQKTTVKYKAHLSLEKIIEQARQAKLKNASTETPVSAYRVLNGTGRPQMAKRISIFLGKNGVDVKNTANARNFGYKTSVIKFLPGYKTEAQQLAKILSVPVKLRESSDLKAKVELTLGVDLLPLDTSIYDGSIRI